MSKVRISSILAKARLRDGLNRLLGFNKMDLGGSAKNAKPVDAPLTNCVPPRFRRGDIVYKVSGKARFWGVVKSAYKIGPETGDWRYDVMAIHPEFFGLVHIYSDKDLEFKDLTEEERIAYGLALPKGTPRASPTAY